jgi:hypothetical protein
MLIATQSNTNTGVLDLEPLKARPCILTDSGRTAIRAAARGLGLREGDEVLLPAYCCGVEITSLRACGLNIRLLPIGRDLVLDPATVGSAIGPRTRAIYVIHYFGHPQPLAELREIADRSGLWLIEDCALALLSCNERGVPLGMTGDAAIFSFTKFFHWIRGGAVAGELEKSPQIEAASELGALADRTRRALAAILRRWGLRPSYAATATSDADALPDLPTSYYAEPGAPAVSMARVYRWPLLGVDIERQRSIRRARWHAWNDLFGELAPALRLRSALEDGAAPLFYAVIVQDRQRWLEALWSVGVPIPPWWLGAPRGFDWSNFREALALKRSVLPLPVDPIVADDAIDQLKRLCPKLARHA